MDASESEADLFGELTGILHYKKGTFRSEIGLTVKPGDSRLFRIKVNDSYYPFPLLDLDKLAAYEVRIVKLAR